MSNDGSVATNLNELKGTQAELCPFCLKGSCSCKFNKVFRRLGILLD